MSMFLGAMCRTWILLVIAGCLVHCGIEAQQNLPGTIGVQEACIRDQLTASWYRCNPPATGALNASITTRAGVASVLRSCMGTGPQTRVRVLMPPFPALGNALKNITDVFSSIMGTSIVVDSSSLLAYYTTLNTSIFGASNINITHESWAVASSSLGDGLATGAFQDVTQMVISDPRMAWSDLFPSMKSHLIYQGKVAGLPFSATPYMLFYRQDLFDKYGWEVPRTWAEFAQLVATRNGTEGLWSFCGNWGPCASLGPWMLRMILASFHQTEGGSHGWSVDPETMRPLWNTPAMTEAVSIMRTLFKYSPTDMSLFSRPQPCSMWSYNFVQRKCMMTLNIPSTFKMVSHISREPQLRGIQGNMGATLTPGSDRVLDRATNQLVPCTERLCPYATRYTKENGSSVLVNHSPLMEVSMFALNAKSAPLTLQSTFEILRVLTSRPVIDRLLLHPDAEAYPSKPYQLSPSIYAKAGFNAADSKRFIAALEQAINHPNVQNAIRFPGSQGLSNTAMAASDDILNKPFKNASTIALAAQTQAERVLDSVAAMLGGADALKIAYWQSINRFIPSPPPPPAPPPPTPPPPFPPAPTMSSGPDLATILPAVLIPGLLAGAALATVVWWYVRSRGRSLKQVPPPGPGPDTTLLVTDIEDSTSLWEELSASDMDTALRLHNSCVRTLAAEHQGYESIWEGDSFTIAFPSVQLAVKFALACQKALLQVAWPSSLLARTAGKEVWLRHKQQGPGAQLSTVNLQGSLTQANLQSDPFKSRQSTSMEAPDVKLEQVLYMDTSLPQKDSVKSFGRPGSDNTPLIDFLVNSAAVEQGGRRLQEGGRKLSLGLGGLVLGAEAGEAGTGLVSNPQAAGQQQGAGKLVTRTLGRRMQHNWQPSAPGSSGAVLAFRGLRIRIGLHSGVLCETDITFNPTMGRYQYKGDARVFSAAVGSCARGGQVIAAWNPVAKRLIASGDKVPVKDFSMQLLYMGQHQLVGGPVEGEIFDLIVLMPDSLSCRFAVTEVGLRNTKCIIPGALAAPMPWKDTAPGMTGGPYLMATQLLGLQALQKWGPLEVQVALREARHWVASVALVAKGIICEDGWSECLWACSNDLPLNNPRPVMLVAFRSAAAAIKCAMEIRNVFLEDPAAHGTAACSPYLTSLDGDVDAPSGRTLSATKDSLPLTPSEQQLQTSPPDAAPGSPSSRLSRVLQLHKSGEHSSRGSMSGPAGPRSRRGSKREPLSRVHPSNGSKGTHRITDTSLGSVDSAETSAFDDQVYGPKTHISRQGYEMGPTSHNGSSNVTSANTFSGMHSTLFTASGFRQSLGLPFRDISRTSTSLQDDPRFGSRATIPGLAARVAVVGGGVKLSIKASTGRACYSGPGRKALEKLLMEAKAGQVATLPWVAREASVAAPTRQGAQQGPSSRVIL